MHSCVPHVVLSSALADLLDAEQLRAALVSALAPAIVPFTGACVADHVGGIQAATNSLQRSSCLSARHLLSDSTALPRHRKKPGILAISSRTTVANFLCCSRRSQNIVLDIMLLERGSRCVMRRAGSLGDGTFAAAVTAVDLAALDPDAAMLGVPAVGRDSCAASLLPMLRRVGRHLVLSCDR